ncbi:hypothetical protein RJZ56_004013 [Blastomyces dermatitidis]|uniref:Uncharacterized protein n=2 Tax=Ajellomyces dermatitidis TaxID=5039 RepID=F2THG5_AJEDA|nr:uncharacterized protein BDCG_08938 [Blastomyces dermatitidis ER-3]EEQ85669.1 hypothetical protein BDCG_08938 [Blastomyces dermatitidis ER-3]EGE82678.1 hypothetical protein BDDG_05622 [Blastomyces dermatitidis ATCC 18188]EQL34539.1 hypothetical protein BDFG_03681 [Blastomyces dermatitidis ATCC 26199]
MTSFPHRRAPAITHTNDLYNRIRSRSFEIDGPRRSKLRRVVSTKSISQYMDSSESVPSEHSSLFDAVLASFESDGSRRQSELDRSEDPGPSNYIPTTLGREDAGIFNSRLAHSHGKWPGKKLETIVEQKSASTLKASRIFSVGDVDGPGINPSLTTRRALSNPPDPFGRKVYSFDDLDLPTRRPKDAVSRLPNRSSSSGASFELRGLLPHTSPVEPTQPLYPPPVRSPTPPGLPSFGSREAIHYNPIQANRSRPSNHQGPASRRGTQQSLAADDEEDDSCCASGFQRLFGLPSCMVARQPALPNGAVARADDGTMVRGRFGARQSGHGVGAGPTSQGLESHPFHRSSLPAARVKDRGDATSVTAVVGQQNSHRTCTSPSQTNQGYSSPQTMPQSYSSLLRTHNAPHLVPPRRSCPTTRNCATGSATSVPLPSYIAHRRLEGPLPRSSEMIHPSNSTSGLYTPGPDGGGNDGTSTTFASVTLTSSQPNPSLEIPESRHGQRMSRQSAMITDSKTAGLWDWLFMDCFFVCCGLFSGNKPSQSQNQLSSQQHSRSALDPTVTSATATGEQIQASLHSSHDHYRRREMSSSTPWTPAWGWQPRCFGGDATMDEEIEVETATEMRIMRPIRAQATAVRN